MKIDGPVFDPFAPDTIVEDRYRIVKRIGEGGYADVYEAERTTSGQRVALKILHVVHGEERIRQVHARFKREAELVAKISHPAIVEIYDFGMTESGRLFTVLELLEGATVDEALAADGPFSPGRAIKLVLQCLDGLQAAHEMGIIHRDLKPSNLFLDNLTESNDRIRVLDFGIAFVVEDVMDRLTRTGQIQGTPGYLAPEYIQAQHVTSALDVYQMALILVEMLTGSPVVNHPNTYKCLMAHTMGALQLPPELEGTPLAPVLDKALATEPSERYADAAEFRAALAEVPAESLEGLTFTPATAEGTPNVHDARTVEGMTPEAMTVDPWLSANGLPPPAAADAKRSKDTPSFPPAASNATPKRMTPLLIALAALLALTVVASLVLSLLTKRPTTETSTNPSEVLVADSKPPTSITPPSRISVRVVTNPDDAEINKDGQSLGRGAATLSFYGADDDPSDITVTRYGYTKHVVTVTPSDAPELLVKLVRKPVRKKPKVPKNPTKDAMKIFD